METSLKCIEFKSTRRNFEFKCCVDPEIFKKLNMNIMNLHNILDVFM